MRNASLLFAALSLGAGACDKSPPEPKQASYAVAGACAQAEGDTLKVTASFTKNCLSSSCDKLVSAACSLSVDGQVVKVDGEAVVARTANEICTSDCRSVQATCELELPAGEYTLAAGKQQLALGHPVSVPTGQCDRL